MNPTITVTISKTGKTSLHVQGVTGQTCTSLTAALEAVLGGKAETELTADYFASGGDDETMGVRETQ